MSTLPFGMDGLLDYNAEFKVLVCRQCGYAVQKSAIGSHLLRLHKVYRGKRQLLLKAVAELELCEPQEMLQPISGRVAVDGLSVTSGWLCIISNCKHITGSPKRMQSHWSIEHGLGDSLPTLSSGARPAKLQTFFRGTKVKYFEVQPSPTTNSRGILASAVRGEIEREQAVVHSARSASTLTPRYDLQTLADFHHLTSQTVQSLPIDGATIQRMIAVALQHVWIMNGLLALSVAHQNTIAGNTPERCERVVAYASHFSTGWKNYCARWSGDNTGKQRADHFAIQPLHRLLQCLQLLSLCGEERDLIPDSFQLKDFLLLLDECTPNEDLGLDTAQHLVLSRPGSLVVEGNLPSNAQLSTTLSEGDTSRQRTSATLLNLISTLPAEMTKTFGRPGNVLDVLAVLTAIKAMTECCVGSFAHDNVVAAQQGVILWLETLPPHFQELLSGQDLAAAVVTAYWAAIVLRRAELMGCWYWTGLAKLIVSQVLWTISNHNLLARELVNRVTKHLD